MKRGGRRTGKKGPTKSAFDRKYRTNERIRAKQLRVISSDGEQLGVMSRNDALEKARNFGLDLIEIAQHAKPPVCKIADFGKMRYEYSKKQKQQKKTQSQSVKTVRLRPNIGENDLNRRINEIQKFLDKGHRVIVQVTMKGRQKKFANLAETLTIDKIQESLIDATMEKPNHQVGQITVAFTKDNSKTS